MLKMKSQCLHQVSLSAHLSFETRSHAAQAHFELSVSLRTDLTPEPPAHISQVPGCKRVAHCWHKASLKGPYFVLIFSVLYLYRRGKYMVKKASKPCLLKSEEVLSIIVPESFNADWLQSP